MKIESLKHPVAARNKGGRGGFTVAVIPGSYMQVRFDGHHAPFLMLYSACENPKCSCRNVVVTFIEEREDFQPKKPHLEFAVELDIDTWKAVKMYNAAPQVKPLVQEFLDRLTEDLQANIRAKHHSFRTAITKAAEFYASPGDIRNGKMIAAAEVFGLSKEPAACGLTWPLMTEHLGSLYHFYDYYCINPSCRCKEVHLAVSRIEGGGKSPASVKPLFSARLSFTGKLQLGEISSPFSRKQAVELLSEWLRANPAAIVELEERYKRIKAAGKRLLKGRA